jgi:hypothetical protein
MQTTDATEELKNAIRLLEIRQSMNGQLLKEQLVFTYDTLKPANLIRSTLKEVTSSPFLIGNLTGSVIGLTTVQKNSDRFIGKCAEKAYGIHFTIWCNQHYFKEC